LVSRDDAFDETEETFFRGSEAPDGASSLRPVTLQGDADDADEAAAASASLRASRRARFVRPVARGVTGLAVASALVFAWAWLRRAPTYEATARAAPRSGAAPLVPTPGSLEPAPQFAEICDLDVPGPLAALAEAEPLLTSPFTSTGDEAPTSAAVKRSMVSGARGRGATGSVTHKGLLAAIRHGLPSRAASVRAK